MGSYIFLESSIIYNSHKKYIGINVTKEINDFHNENYKMLMKQIWRHNTKWKEILCSLVGEINTVKMCTLSRMSYRFSENTYWNTNYSLPRAREKNLKIYMEAKKTPQSNLGEKEQRWRHHNNSSQSMWESSGKMSNW